MSGELLTAPEHIIARVCCSSRRDLAAASTRQALRCLISAAPVGVHPKTNMGSNGSYQVITVKAVHRRTVIGRHHLGHGTDTYTSWLCLSKAVQLYESCGR